MIQILKRTILYLNNKLKMYFWLREMRHFGCRIMKPEAIMSVENIQLGKNIYIGPQAYIMASGGLEIKDNVIIGPKVMIWTENHNYKSEEFIPYGPKNISKRVTINQNVWIGLGVMICPGSEIGEGAIVSMGSVVHGSVPSCSIVAGNPAVVIGKRNEEIYYKLKQAKKFYNVWGGMKI